MTNRRRARRSRRPMTATERFMADRYPPHRNLTSLQIRKILVDDGVARQPTPLTWMVNGITHIAVKERLPRDTVFEQINAECIAKCGLPLPETGIVR